MKIRLAAVDCLSTSGQFNRFGFTEEISFTDFDAVVVDPTAISELWTARLRAGSDGRYTTFSNTDDGFGLSLNDLFSRRRKEAADLLNFRGGILFVFIPKMAAAIEVRRDNKGIKHSNISWLPKKDFIIGRDNIGRPETFKFPEEYEFLNRRGSDIRWRNENQSIAAALRPVKDRAVYSGALQGVPPSEFSEVIANDPVGGVVSACVKFGKGRIVFLPSFPGVNDPELGGVISDCAKRLLKKHDLSPAPKWALEMPLPTEDEAKAKVDEEAQRVKLARKDFDAAKEKLSELSKLRALLYESGSVLEEAVRTVFRMVGFTVPEPEDYEEEFDVYIPSHAPEVIGEIEGGEKLVDVAKYRQLLDYTQKRVLQGKAVKGILIGNGFCLTDSKKRGEQFTAQAIAGCESQKFCRVTTSELFRVAVWLLASKRSVADRTAIRKSLTECAGKWEFKEP